MMRRGWLLSLQLAWLACSGGATTGPAIEEKPAEILRAPRSPMVDAAPVTPEGAAPPYALAPVVDGATLTGVVTTARPGATVAGTSACGTPRGAPMSVDAAGGVAGALVWIEIARGREPRENAIVDASITSCRFTPVVALLPRVGAELSIRNDDTIRHEVVVEWFDAEGAGDPERLAAIPMPLEGAKFGLPMARPGRVKLSCSLHPSEVGWAFVPPHPYHVLTGPDGKFTISDVPPGRYRVFAWHPGAPDPAPRVVANVDLAPGATREVALSLQAP